ncbi:BGTF surface domain-containing protein [Halosimplex aquaticum]
MTNVRPGLNVTVRLRSDFTASDSDEWVARRTTATVAEGGTFSAAFDLSDVSNGTVVDATVRLDDRNILDREGYDPPESATVVVTAPTGSIELRGTERNASGSYDAVTVDATLSRGGFVVLHRGSATGPIAGVSGNLSPGRHEEVPVYVGYATESSDALVAVVHRDGNQNRWFDNATVDRPYGTTGDAAAETGFAPPSPGSPRQPTQTNTPTPAETEVSTAVTATDTAGGATESATVDETSAATDDSAVTETDGSTAATTARAEQATSRETTTTTAGTGPRFTALTMLLAGAFLTLFGFARRQ